MFTVTMVKMSRLPQALLISQQNSPEVCTRLWCSSKCIPKRVLFPQKRSSTTIVTCPTSQHSCGSEKMSSHLFWRRMRMRWQLSRSGRLNGIRSASLPDSLKKNTEQERSRSCRRDLLTIFEQVYSKGGLLQLA